MDGYDNGAFGQWYADPYDDLYAEYKRAAGGEPNLHAVLAELVEVTGRQSGSETWTVRLADGSEARAISYSSLVGDLSPGQIVWLNTTAVELGLGTGGFHYVLAPLPKGLGLTRDAIGSPPRPEAGHLMKLRYTPLQHRVQAVEEETSPHRAALEGVRDLAGLPVIAAELHSAAMAVALAGKACGARRVVYVMTDGAALPLALSRLVARLRSAGVLSAVITAGQAFGGDHETVTVASAFLAARAVCNADLVIVSQGPGNAGTATPFGFSGVAQAEHLNTAAALGGRPVACLRVSCADPRQRHRGLSHHSATVLGRMTLARAWVAVPVLPASDGEGLARQIEAAGLPRRHEIRRINAGDLLGSLQQHRDLLTTMGRSLEEDEAYFLSACAAARLALQPEAGLPWGE